MICAPGDQVVCISTNMAFKYAVRNVDSLNNVEAVAD